jgi:hypothetical protein
MKADPSVKTPTAYIKQLPPERRKDILAVHQAIKKAAPSLRAHICNGMLGYGQVHYETKSGCVSDWCVVGLANQKSYMSAYLCCAENGKYLAEAHAGELGNVKCGKSCIRFRKLEDLDLGVFSRLVKKAAELHRNGHFAH